jgi:lysophospholipase L1-like esterase
MTVGQLLTYTVGILGGLLVLIFLLQTYWVSRALQIGEKLEQSAERVSAKPANPERRILIIGDSIWAGVGAADPADSMAGRLRESYPRATIVNQAVSGARLADGAGQLAAGEERYANFDTIFIQLGANDILHLAAIPAAMETLEDLLTSSQESANQVIFTVSGSVGHAPVFLWPFDWFYTARTRRYLTAARAVAKVRGVAYVDLFRERQNDPFVQDPERFYAADGFHPSGAGYGIWYQTCEAAVYFFEPTEGVT